MSRRRSSIRGAAPERSWESVEKLVSHFGELRGFAVHSHLTAVARGEKQYLSASRWAQDDPLDVNISKRVDKPGKDSLFNGISVENGPIEQNVD